MTVMTNQASDLKPLMLLDIDGVLNIYRAWIPMGTYTDDEGRQRTRYRAPASLVRGKALQYDLLLHPEHPRWIAELEERFDVRWGSMWQDKAWHFGEAAGYGVGWDWVDFDALYEFTGKFSQMRGAGVGPYKDSGIRKTLGDRPGVWVDDDMTPSQKAWAADRDAAGIPTLFIQPNPKHGLTAVHMDRIRAFADRLGR